MSSSNYDAPNRLPELGLLRAEGLQAHAWVAERGIVGDGGLYIEPDRFSFVGLQPGGPVMYSGDAIGEIRGITVSTDGYLVVRAGMRAEIVGAGRLRAQAEFDAEVVVCAGCGTWHRRGGSRCECIDISPTLTLIGARVVSVRLDWVGCDISQRWPRQRLLGRMFPSALPATQHKQ